MRGRPIEAGWIFIEEERLRDRCDFVRALPLPESKYLFIAPEVKRDGGIRCNFDGKYRRGDEYRCGMHVPREK